jgi:hypothetical protein
MHATTPRFLLLRDGVTNIFIQAGLRPLDLSLPHFLPLLCWDDRHSADHHAQLTVSLNISYYKSCNLVFFQNCFGYSRSFHFLHALLSWLVNFYRKRKRPYRILTRVWLGSVHQYEGKCYITSIDSPNTCQWYIYPFQSLVLFTWEIIYMPC